MGGDWGITFKKLPWRGTASLLQARQLSPKPRAWPGIRAAQNRALAHRSPHAEKTCLPSGNSCSSGLQLQGAWVACVTELGFRPTGGSQLSSGQDFLTEPMASRVGLRPRAHAGIWRTADFLTACSSGCPKPLPLVLRLGLCPGRSQLHRPITSRPQTGPWGQGPRPPAGSVQAAWSFWPALRVTRREAGWPRPGGPAALKSTGPSLLAASHT